MGGAAAATGLLCSGTVAGADVLALFVVGGAEIVALLQFSNRHKTINVFLLRGRRLALRFEYGLPISGERWFGRHLMLAHARCCS